MVVYSLAGDQEQLVEDSLDPASTERISAIADTRAIFRSTATGSTGRDVMPLTCSVQQVGNTTVSRSQHRAVNPDPNTFVTDHRASRCTTSRPDPEQAIARRG